MSAHDVRCEQTGAVATALAVEWGVWQKTSEFPCEVAQVTKSKKV